VTGRPLVSVVIATRDRWPLLERALGCALRQEGVDVEVIVVDDSSSDETPQRLAALDDRRVVKLTPQAPGPAGARNAGLAVARAEWVAFLDDDDLWAPHKLRSQLEVAAATGAEWVYGTAVMVDAQARPIKALPVPEPERLARRLLDTNPIGGPSGVLARTGLVRDAGGFDERLPYVEDWDLYLRLAPAARAAACHEVVVAYRVHGANKSIRDTDDVHRSFAIMREKHAAAAAAAGVGFGEEWLSRYIALEARRDGRRFAAAAQLVAGAVRARRAGNVPRAVGVLLGEPVMRAGQRLTAGSPATPAWLRHA
jgi:glycosyltransferase involved in cell wall biosynthesis